jgi:hypothetical protein
MPSGTHGIINLHPVNQPVPVICDLLVDAEE